MKCKCKKICRKAESILSFSYENIITEGQVQIRLKRLKPKAPDFGGPKILGVRTISSTFVSNYICIFVLVQRTFLYYAA